MSKPEVAIVGIGIHPFGRTPERSGQDQGVYAVRQALKDAGLEWKDIQFAFGGSAAAGAADTMVSKLGLTGLQFINVANGCATGGSALFSAYNTIASGAYDVGIAVGYDKHERRRVPGEHPRFGPRRLVREERVGPDHAVLRNEDQPLHGDVRHLPQHAGQGVGEGLPQRSAQRERVAPPAHPRGADPRVRHAELPAHQVHVLLASRGRRGPDPRQGRSGAQVHRHAHLPQRRCSAEPPLGLLRGHGAVDRPRRRRRAHGRHVQGRLRDGGHGARGHRSGAAPGHRGRRGDHAHGRERVL